MELSGRLASVPLSDLLQWVANDRLTGSLVVRTSHREKRVFFTDGEVLGCFSGDPDEYFGQFLLLGGYLGRDQLVQALSWCGERQRRLGSALVELGLLPAETVQEALRLHIEDKVCDLFLWEHGVFYFESRPLEEEDLLPEPIDTVALVMEGSRWVDEVGRIQRVFIHDNIALRQGERWPEDPESPLHRRILEAFEEGITIAELYEKTKGIRFRFLEALFDLTVRSVLDIQGVGDEIASRSSHEIRLLDLLMEQAAEEEVLFHRRHLSLPMDVLDRFYPVWIEVEESGELPAEALDFCRAMDGTASLRRLVIEDETQREVRMERFLRELRKGRVALLPRPLDEMSDLNRRLRSAWLRRLFPSSGA